MKSRHLLWIDAISFPNLFGPDAREFAAPRRVQDCCVCRGELKRIPIAAGYYGSAARALLSSNRTGEKVVRFEPWSFGVRKPKGGEKLRQSIELFDQFLIELAPALIGGNISWRFVGASSLSHKPRALEDGAGQRASSPRLRASRTKGGRSARELQLSRLRRVTPRITNGEAEAGAEHKRSSK